MILVVDDDRDLREMLCEVLETEGYVAAGARNGLEALAALRAARDRVCLVVLDVMMPVMSGVEFRRRQGADAELAAIPVAVMSARWEAKDQFDGLDFIEKPIHLDKLLAIVRRRCGGGESRGPERSGEEG